MTRDSKPLDVGSIPTSPAIWERLALQRGQRLRTKLEAWETLGLDSLAASSKGDVPAKPCIKDSPLILGCDAG